MLPIARTKTHGGVSELGLLVGVTLPGNGRPAQQASPPPRSAERYDGPDHSVEKLLEKHRIRIADRRKRPATPAATPTTARTTLPRVGTRRVFQGWFRENFIARFQPINSTVPSWRHYRMKSTSGPMNNVSRQRPVRFELQLAAERHSRAVFAASCRGASALEPSNRSARQTHSKSSGGQVGEIVHLLKNRRHKPGYVIPIPGLSFFMILPTMILRLLMAAGSTVVRPDPPAIARSCGGRVNRSG